MPNAGLSQHGQHTGMKNLTGLIPRLVEGVVRAFEKQYEGWQVRQADTESFAAHLLETEHDIRTIQELLDHRNLQTTMIYMHVATKNVLGVRSPLDK